MSADDAVKRVRASLMRQGPKSLIELGKCFRELDESGTGAVSRRDFGRVLDAFSISLSEQVPQHATVAALILSAPRSLTLACGCLRGDLCAGARCVVPVL